MLFGLGFDFWFDKLMLNANNESGSLYTCASCGYGNHAYIPKDMALFI